MESQGSQHSRTRLLDIEHDVKNMPDSFPPITRITPLPPETLATRIKDASSVLETIPGAIASLRNPLAFLIDRSAKALGYKVTHTAPAPQEDPLQQQRKDLSALLDRINAFPEYRKRKTEEPPDNPS